MRRRRYVYGFPGTWAGPKMWAMACGPWGKHGHGYDFTMGFDEDDLEALEELQRDLEEAAADVADRIRRIKENETTKADA